MCLRPLGLLFALVGAMTSGCGALESDHRPAAPSAPSPAWPNPTSDTRRDSTSANSEQASASGAALDTADPSAVIRAPGPEPRSVALEPSDDGFAEPPAPLPDCEARLA